VAIKYVRLDNTGENKAFAQLANSRKWNLQLCFKFTGAMTPQRNYLVEIRFAMLWGRMQAMFNAAYIPEHEKYRLIREGIHHLTFLDGLIVTKVDEKRMTKFVHMYGKDPCQCKPGEKAAL
jgi:hypothetical protein